MPGSISVTRTKTQMGGAVRPGVLLLNLDSRNVVCGSLREFFEQHSIPWQEHEIGPVAVGLADVQSVSQVICLAFSNDRLADATRLVDSLHRSERHLPIVVVTEQLLPEAMFQLLEAGAADFISPPWRDHEILPRLWRYLQASPTPEDEEDEGAFTGLGLIGRSAAFREQLQRLPQIAACGASVLISGETGTGKEVFAQAIHRLSPQAKGPFIPVNCGAIPVELLENELFGHSRGAFTGAADLHKGLISAADGGTLFLDEIDSLPLLAQVKLLRFLQDKEYRSLGSTQTQRAQVRVIAATNVDIELAVQQGKLRQDLYYRLNIVTLALPALRQRAEDVLVLAHHFLERYNATFNKRVTGITVAAQQRLLRHSWPGNVRELEHLVARGVALATGHFLDVADVALPGEGEQPASFREAKARVVQEWERTYLESLLLACHGNISRAAEVAQKDRRAFWELLRKHHINVRCYREALPAPGRAHRLIGSGAQVPVGLR